MNFFLMLFSIYTVLLYTQSYVRAQSTPHRFVLEYYQEKAGAPAEPQSQPSPAPRSRPASSRSPAPNLVEPRSRPPELALPQEAQSTPDETEAFSPVTPRKRSLYCESCRKEAQQELRDVIEKVTPASVTDTPKSEVLPPFFCRTDSKPVGLLVDPYCAQHVGWSSSLRDKTNEPSNFEPLTPLRRAKWYYESYVKLLQSHQLDYDPRVLLCKVVNESNLLANRVNSGSGASGLGQVLMSTVIDLFSRYSQTRSKVFGFEKITSGATFFQQMVHSPLAQLEIGMLVLNMKRVDFGGDITANLKNYLGSTEAENMAYARRINACAACIERTSLAVNEGRLQLSELRQPYSLAQPGRSLNMTLSQGSVRNWNNQVIQQDCLQKARN